MAGPIWGGWGPRRGRWRYQPSARMPWKASRRLYKVGIGGWEISYYPPEITPAF